jgi:hypothetical protein
LALILLAAELHLAWAYRAAWRPLLSRRLAPTGEETRASRDTGVAVAATS